MANVYEIVTQKVLEKLEKGVIPWRKPWVNRGQAVNWLTQKPYRGINTMLLDPGEYATFNQISSFGGKVKKGEASQIVVFWKWIDKENEETGKSERVPFLRYYRVWEINSQCEGLNSRRNDEENIYEHDPIEEAEKIISGYFNHPDIRYASGRAYYVPSLDYVSVPPMADYKQPEEYYSTLFHELVHSTGHESRLNRPTLTSKAGFGSEIYSKEELVAEMGSAMLSGVAGFLETTIDNSAAYIKSWSKKLKEDSRLVVMAASQAQKAADHILGTSYKDSEE